MATPIAHKGVIAGAKVQAMTVIDLLMRPELVAQAWDYFRNVQAKNVTYTPLIRPEDTPAIWLNEETMAKYRPEMKNTTTTRRTTRPTSISSESSTPTIR